MLALLRVLSIEFTILILIGWLFLSLLFEFYTTFAYNYISHPPPPQYEISMFSFLLSLPLSLLLSLPPSLLSLPLPLSLSLSPSPPPPPPKNRHSKPFNPLLGETYELVNQEGNYCVVSEQVSHHPPVTALHAESDNWVFWEEYKLDIKFRGQVGLPGIVYPLSSEA